MISASHPGLVDGKMANYKKCLYLLFPLVYPPVSCKTSCWWPTQIAKEKSNIFVLPLLYDGVTLKLIMPVPSLSNNLKI